MKKYSLYLFGKIYFIFLGLGIIKIFLEDLHYSPPYDYIDIIEIIYPLTLAFLFFSMTTYRIEVFEKHFELKMLGFALHRIEYKDMLRWYYRWKYVNQRTFWDRRCIRYKNKRGKEKDLCLTSIKNKDELINFIKEKNPDFLVEA